jgi:hypothetical protein
MKRGLQALLPGVAICLVALALGCGGSDSSSTEVAAETSAKPRNLKKYDFVFHASIVCKKGLEQADVAMHKAAGEPAPKQPSSAPDWEGTKLPLEVVLPAFRRITTQLEALEPSKADSYNYEKFITRLQEDLKQAEANPNAPISSRPLAGAGKVAYVWGLHACLF